MRQFLTSICVLAALAVAGCGSNDPGQERVISVAREEAYAEGKQPTIESLHMTPRRCARFILFAACAFLLGVPTANSQTRGTARTVPPAPATAAVSRGNIVPGRSVDAQFRLAPGAARIATFNVIRYESGPKPAGSRRAFDTVLAELRPLPNGTQTEVVRDHSVHLTDLSAGGAVGTAAPAPGSVADKLRGILGGSQK
jgi:hypothetical protein